MLPIPFNLHMLQQVFPKQADSLTQKLLAAFQEGTKVSILELMEHPDLALAKTGKYVYENIYLTYTMRQWGKKPEELDPSVTGRLAEYKYYDMDAMAERALQLGCRLEQGGFMDILTVLREKYPEMTKKQKQIADFMMAYPEQMTFITLKELSSLVNATEVTI